MLKTLAEWLDRRFGWGRLPYLLGLFTLVFLRARLRERNLYDTGVPTVDGPPGDLTARRPDGYFNDVQQPGMGGVAATFGRNAPSLPGDPERSPSAREVSEALFTRHSFLPASHLNVIAAAWLHDIGYRSLLRDRGFHPLGRSTCAGKAGPSPCAILSRIIPVAASSRAFAGSTINCASSN